MENMKSASLLAPIEVESLIYDPMDCNYNLWRSSLVLFYLIGWDKFPISLSSRSVTASSRSWRRFVSTTDTIPFHPIASSHIGMACCEMRASENVDGSVYSTGSLISPGDSRIIEISYYQFDHVQTSPSTRPTPLDIRRKQKTPQCDAQPSGDPSSQIIFALIGKSLLYLKELFFRYIF